MPPKTENGELEEDLGLTPATTPIADTEANTDASANAEDNAQQSSGGQDEGTPEGPKSMAEAIEAALGKTDAKTEEDPASKTPEEPAGAKSEADKSADPAGKEPDADKSKAPAENGEADDDPTDEELGAYAPKPQKRIKQLLSQRNTYRRQAEELEPDANHYRNIRQFMAESNLQDGEVAELFKVGRLLRGKDPQGFEDALDIVMPIAQQLLELTGRSLPQELREQVESGALTEEHAREQAKLRTRAALAEQRATEVETRVETQQTQQARTAHQQAVQTAVGAWEQRVRQSDPDFGLKADAMRDAALALIAEKGPPQSPEQAVQYAQATYDRVSKWMSLARPGQKPSRPTPQSGQNGNRGGHAPEPKSLEGAILGALRAGRA